MAPWAGIVPMGLASVERGFHIGHARQISVESRTMICRSFQQHHGESSAENQYGLGMRRVGTDQWQLWGV